MFTSALPWRSSSSSPLEFRFKHYAVTPPALPSRTHRKLVLMPDLWYQFLSQFCAHFYFSRVEVLPAAPRLSGPTLLVALHRNGAVDGWVYKSIFPRATFLIAAQLRKNLLAKIFFTGISVVRDKDEGDRCANAAAMQLCQKLLATGGVLAIFPEGTSSLGPRHLPFKSGAARIAHEAWQSNIPLTVIPLGITYDAPSTFRSHVQVIVGEPLTHISVAALSLGELKHELSSRLESLGINAASDEQYRDIQVLASLVSPEIPYHQALKSLERSLPTAIQNGWPALRDSLAGHNLLHADKEPFSPRPILLTVGVAVLLAPLVLAAALLNAPLLLGAYLAGRRLADASNVITLWRILIGAPLLVVWLFGVLFSAFAFNVPTLFHVYLILSALGLFAYAPWKHSARQSFNAIRFPTLRLSCLALRSTLLRELRAHVT